MNLYDFINKVSDLATKDHVIVPSSSGFASEITQQAWKVKKGQRIICNPGLGSMGFAIPHAIGASIASNRPVICIEGDGSLQHNIQELQTITRLNLNILIFVLNNNGYASIRNTHQKFFNNDLVEQLTFPPLLDLSITYFMDYELCNDLTKLEKIFNHDLTRPSLIEVIINPDQKKESSI